MEDQIAELNRQMEAVRRETEADRSRCEELQRQTEADRSARKAAQEFTQLQTFPGYLRGHHELDCSKIVVTNKALTTQDDTTSPVVRYMYHPRRIVPWRDFKSRQAEKLDLLFASPFSSHPVFRSKAGLEDIKYLLPRLISSKWKLGLFEGNTVELAVEELIAQICKDSELQGKFGLSGTVGFESHANQDRFCIYKTSYSYFMLLSWAGQPLGYIAEKLTDKDAVVNAATTAFMALHEAQILHCDAEPRNVLYDMSNGKLMIVDFERSAVCDRQSLNSISPNRKRKQDMLGKDSSDNFAMEMRSAERAIRNLRFG